MTDEDKRERQRGYAKRWYIKNSEKVKQKSIEYRLANIEKCRKAQKKCYEKRKDSDEYREYHKEYKKEYLLREGEAIKVRARGLARGIEKNNACIDCGNSPTELHHEDYSKPLDVMELCNRHHKDLHIKLRENAKDI